ncbi:hypothetical protein V8G54_022015 [Vigna mungo]|uniref:Secreted protein n=1 Tax=Vigna mungo TaxID=3915 RepID=A0AAQ3NEE8_VIGMU
MLGSQLISTAAICLAHLSTSSGVSYIAHVKLEAISSGVSFGSSNSCGLTSVRQNPSCSGLHPNLLATSHRPALLKVLYIDFLFGLLYCPSSTPASPGGKCKLNLESTSSTSLSDSASFSELMTDSNN